MTEQTEGKGRPTPKRNESQKRRGPVAPPPTSRRQAAKQLRAKQAEERRRIREGSLGGDESKMLPRDRGPVRKLVRDLVDGRRSMAWILLPVTVVALLAGFARNVALQNLTFTLLLATMAATLIDMAFTAVDLRRGLRAAFPDVKTRSHIAYGLMRTTQMRRLRVPRPQVRP